MPTMRHQLRVALALAIGLTATPAFAQAERPEAERAAAGAAGDSASPSGSGSEHHAGAEAEGEAEDADPTQHFNFVGLEPGHVFDYIGKDEYGGKFGDGVEQNKAGQTFHEEEPASPPFIFMLLNFALLLAILAWKGWPVANKAAADRHDQIKSALDEAAKLHKQAADKVAEYDRRLKDADAQIKQLVDGIRGDADSEKQRILAAAEAQAVQMKRDAELRIAAEIELARGQLTREVIAAATAATEKLLRDKMTSADQHKLVGAFIADVQQGGAASRAGRPGQGDA